MSQANFSAGPFNRRHVLQAAVGSTVSSLTWAQPSAAPSLMTKPHPDLALKLVIMGRRKPGTTMAEHRHHIRHVHGELVLQNIAVDPDAAPRRYVQNPVFDSSFRATRPGSDPFALNRDFVTQIWMPDFAAVARGLQSRFYLDKVKGDEDNFVDQATVVFMPTRERVVAEISPPTSASVKLFCCVQRAPSVTPEAFRQAWIDATRMSGAAKLHRHVQNDTLPGPRGPAPLDGIDEFWFEDETSARAGLKLWQTGVGDALVRSGHIGESGHFALLAQEQVLFAGLGRT